jgi:hypothetical protein
MVSSIDALLSTLEERLPEIEWQLQRLKPSEIQSLLPLGLFKKTTNETAQTYLQEICKDIQWVREQETLTAKEFIAHKIHQKIHVLVAICTQSSPQQPTTNRSSFLNIETLSTRAAWIKKLETALEELELQKKALLRTSKKHAFHPELLLKIQQELGELEKQLTLAQEAYDKAN